MLRRDLLCLVRQEPGALGLCLVPPLVVVPSLIGLSRNAGLHGVELTFAAVCLLALTAPVWLT